MKDRILSLVKRHTGPDAWRRWCAFVVGVAQDYWKDPTPETRAAGAKRGAVAPSRPIPAGTRWHADRIALIEKIWGVGQVLPGGEAFLDQMMAPLGLNGSMNVLDLAAGLGGPARSVAETFGAYVAGMEPDAELAKRGMEMSVQLGRSKHASIDAYDLAKFAAAKHYDRIMARELFYRIADKPKFFKAVAAGLKPQGHLVFTDYILDPEAREQEAVKAWLTREAGASPLSLDETTQTWTKLGFDVRVTEDETVLYRREILKGLARFALFLAKHPPDDATKPLVAEQIELWGGRAVALEHGLKFYRFHAIKS